MALSKENPKRIQRESKENPKRIQKESEKNVQFCGQRRNDYMEVKDDHERFTRLLIQHEPELLRCALVAVPNRADARDILQECSVALWRRFPEYDPERPFAAWALGFVRMEVRRFLRKSARRSQLTARAAELVLQDQQQYAAELDEREGFLKHCFDALAEPHRDLLYGYYHKEHSVGELSQQSGRSVDAVYKMLQRIRGALHRCIESKMRRSAT
jgi:RNA polymerase sigma-70 factor (ECF subfamily)